jgi:hypothetical protein
MLIVQYIAKTIVTARDAIASHIRWKITLLTAVKLHEPLSARATHSIEHPDECSIRQWLLSQHTLHLRRAPEYRAALDRHTEFHREMLKIAALINSADYAAAECLLNSPAGFQSASNAVANAIMALDRIPAAGLAS